MKTPDLILVVTAICLVLLSGCAPLPAATSETSAPVSRALATSTPAPAPDAPDILRAYVDAFNRHDTDAILALFADKGLRFIDTGFIYTADKAKVRDYLDFAFGVGSVAKIEGCTGEGDTWRCVLLARDGCMGAFPSVTDAHSDLTVKLQDGKIQQFSTKPRAADRKVYDEVQPKLDAWVKANRPDDWKTLDDPNTDARAAGELWAAVCAAYIATLK